jgi:hypothetical protein
MNTDLIQAVEAISEAWLGKLGVVSVADAYEEGPGPAVLVLVEGDMEPARRQLPGSIRGFPVVVRAGGPMVLHHLGSRP